MGGKRICPRCGQPISWVETFRKGGHTYYVAVHYQGYYKDSSGKIRKKVRKCYLGPDIYDYGSRTHTDLGLTLRGAIEERRVIAYLDAFISSLLSANVEKETLEKILNKLKNLTEELEEILHGEGGKTGKSKGRNS